ncbi:MAG TPA: class II aldolase/adducin family protein [Thiotrichales bacterium]|nr:class II aldolase/adducin family protein [Thiotrichales bacterium]
MALTHELVRYYRLLRTHGVNDSHSGNVSVRDGDAIWITPTGACADTLRPEQLLRVPLEGPIPAGGSLDTPLHLAVYRANPTAGAVFHSHGPHVVALTLDGDDFFPADFEGQYYFPRVPVIDLDLSRYVEEAPARVAEVLAEHRVCVVRGHGVYCQGEEMDLAYKWSCSVELSARTAFLARMAGTVTRI